MDTDNGLVLARGKGVWQMGGEGQRGEIGDICNTYNNKNKKHKKSIPPVFQQEKRKKERKKQVSFPSLYFFLRILILPLGWIKGSQLLHKIVFLQFLWA